MNPNGKKREGSGRQKKREQGGRERKRGRIRKTGLDSGSQFRLQNCPSAIRSHPCKFCCSSKPIRLQ